MSICLCHLSLCPESYIPFYVRLILYNRSYEGCRRNIIWFSGFCLFVFPLFVCLCFFFQFWVLEEYVTKWQIEQNNGWWSLFLCSHSGCWCFFLTVDVAVIWKGFSHLEGFIPAGSSLQFSLSAFRARHLYVFAELGNTSPAMIVKRNLPHTCSVQTCEVRECLCETYLLCPIVFLPFWSLGSEGQQELGLMWEFCGLRLGCDFWCGPLILENLCRGCKAKFLWQWKAKRGLVDCIIKSLEKYGNDIDLQHCKSSFLSFIYKSIMWYLGYT